MPKPVEEKTAPILRVLYIEKNRDVADAQIKEALKSKPYIEITRVGSFVEAAMAVGISIGGNHPYDVVVSGFVLTGPQSRMRNHAAFGSFHHPSAPLPSPEGGKAVLNLIHKRLPKAAIYVLSGADPQIIHEALGHFIPADQILNKNGHGLEKVIAAAQRKYKLAGHIETPTRPKKQRKHRPLQHKK